MSYSREQLETIENARADFDEFLSKWKLADAEILVHSLEEQGFTGEAAILRRDLRNAHRKDSFLRSATESFGSLADEDPRDIADRTNDGQ